MNENSKRVKVEEAEPDFVPTVRGAFSPSEDTTALKNGVPVFTSSENANDWCKELAKEPGSIRPQFLHAITTFVGWAEVEKYLLPRILNSPKRHFVEDTLPFPSISPEIEAELTNRLLLHHHRKFSVGSTVNALYYAFFQMRCGILVQIRSNQVYTFAPFVNDTYRNRWSTRLHTDFGPVTKPDALKKYYAAKKSHCRPENILPDPGMWWANGNIICNEHDSSTNGVTQWWGDNMLLPFKHMLEAVCESRPVPDVDFFFNKRDHPQLRTNPTLEAYDFMFDEKETRLPEEYRYSMLAPFCSFYGSPEFSDLLCPTVEDWKNANPVVFPETTINVGKSSDLFLKENFDKFYVEWEDKQDVALFRGNATGGGVTPETNQRLKLCLLSNQQQKSGAKWLDCKVIGMNVRDKKLFGQPMKFAHTRELLPFKGNFIPMYEQSKFKYIFYVEGHCAANRYSFLMRLGSVILKVESTCTASELWFFPVLVAQDCSRDFNLEEISTADYVAVRKDLSDLEEKVKWCQRNDHICKQIARNAQALYERVLSRDAILDYWQLLFQRMAQNECRLKNTLFSYPKTVPLNPPQSIKVNPHKPCSPDGDCLRCKEEKAAAATTV